MSDFESPKSSPAPEAVSHTSGIMASSGVEIEGRLDAESAPGSQTEDADDAECSPRAGRSPKPRATPRPASRSPLGSQTGPAGPPQLTARPAQGREAPIWPASPGGASVGKKHLLRVQASQKGMLSVVLPTSAIVREHRRAGYVIWGTLISCFILYCTWVIYGRYAARRNPPTTFSYASKTWAFPDVAVCPPEGTWVFWTFLALGYHKTGESKYIGFEDVEPFKNANDDSCLLIRSGNAGFAVSDDTAADRTWQLSVKLGFLTFSQVTEYNSPKRLRLNYVRDDVFTEKVQFMNDQLTTDRVFMDDIYTDQDSFIPYGLAYVNYDNASETSSSGSNASSTTSWSSFGPSSSSSAGSSSSTASEVKSGMWETVGWATTVVLRRMEQKALFKEAVVTHPTTISAAPQFTDVRKLKALVKHQKTIGAYKFKTGKIPSGENMTFYCDPDANWGASSTSSSSSSWSSSQANTTSDSASNSTSTTSWSSSYWGNFTMTPEYTIDDVKAMDDLYVVYFLLNWGDVPSSKRWTIRWTFWSLVTFDFWTAPGYMYVFGGYDPMWVSGASYWGSTYSVSADEVPTSEEAVFSYTSLEAREYVPVDGVPNGATANGGPSRKLSAANSDLELENDDDLDGEDEIYSLGPKQFPSRAAGLGARNGPPSRPSAATQGVSGGAHVAGHNLHDVTAEDEDARSFALENGCDLSRDTPGYDGSCVVSRYIIKGGNYYLYMYDYLGDGWVEGQGKLLLRYRKAFSENEWKSVNNMHFSVDSGYERLSTMFTIGDEAADYGSAIACDFTLNRGSTSHFQLQYADIVVRNDIYKVETLTEVDPVDWSAVVGVIGGFWAYVSLLFSVIFVSTSGRDPLKMQDKLVKLIRKVPFMRITSFDEECDMAEPMTPHPEPTPTRTLTGWKVCVGQDTADNA